MTKIHTINTMQQNNKKKKCCCLFRRRRRKVDRIAFLASTFLLLPTAITVMMMTGSLSFAVAVADSSSSSSSSSSTSTTKDYLEEEEWQKCDIFLAPTPNEEMGWGVFAGRDFQKGEIVEFTSNFIPMSTESNEIHHSILHDHVYGYWRIQFPTGRQNNHPDIEQLHVVLLGMGMFYNHHPTNPNVEYTTFSREPAFDVPNTAQAVGFIAKRHIQPGEQLFSHYGDYDDDNNQFWFTERQIELKSMSNNPGNIPSDELSHHMMEYCSKIYSGLGLPTWRDRVLPILPPPETLPFSISTQKGILPPFDSGYAKAKIQIDAGQRVEISTGMILSKKSIQNSPLGAIIISWDDLDGANKRSLMKLRQDGRLILQHQSNDTSWKRIDKFQSLQDISILPASGNGGTIQRVKNNRGVVMDDGEDSVGNNNNDNDDDDLSNCKLVIHSTMLRDTLGVTLEWIATKNIGIGETIKVNLPPAGSDYERHLFEKELILTGQIHYYDDDDHYGSTLSSSFSSKTIQEDEL